jgi:hypothetical protein
MLEIRKKMEFTVKILVVPSNYIKAGNTSVLRAARVPPELCVTTPLTKTLWRVNGALGPAGKSTSGSQSAAFTFMHTIKNATNITHKIIVLLQ